MKNVLILIISFLLFAGCGRGISGTGQHGEAIVAGTVQNSNGVPAAYDSIVIARSTYSTSVSLRGTYDEYTLDTIETNGEGEFHIKVPVNGEYTISSRTDTSLLYYDDIYVSGDGIHLGNLQYEAGDTVKIYPWWENDNYDDTFFVEGTDWYLTAEDTLVSTFILPNDSITLVHFIEGEDEEFEFNADDTFYLGDTTSWKDSLDMNDSSDFKDTSNGEWNNDSLPLIMDFPETVSVMEEVVFYAEALQLDEAYVVFWSDNELGDTLFSDTFSRTFDIAGEYVLTMQLLTKISDLQEWDSTGLFDIDTIIVIDTFKGGDSIRQK